MPTGLAQPIGIEQIKFFKPVNTFDMQHKDTSELAGVSNVPPKSSHKCTNNPKCTGCLAESIATIDHFNHACPDTLISTKLTAKQICFLATLIEEAEPTSIMASLDMVFETACFLSSVDWSQDGRECLYTVKRLLDSLRLLI